jgi:hypothetical protein
MFYSAMTPKQKRTINNDLNTLFSVRAFSEGRIEDWRRLGIGAFAREIKFEGGSLLLSDKGIAALSRICRLVSDTPPLVGSVSAGDVSAAVKKSYNEWFQKKLQPDDGQEFVDPIVEELLGTVKTFDFLIKLEGLDLKDQDAITLGSVRIQRSDPSLLQSIKFNNLDTTSIKSHFDNSLWLIGKAKGSGDVALERFQIQVVLTIGILAVCAGVLYRGAIRRSRVHPLMSVAGPGQAIMSNG